MKLYQFKRLIEKYSVPFTLLVETDGHYEVGEWVEGKSEDTEENGALVPLPSSLIYQSGGRLTQYDRHLYIEKEIPLKSKVLYKGVTYHVESKTPYADYADFNQYVLKANDAN